MTWLVSTSLKLRVIVLALSIVLIVFGVQTLKTAPLDVFPEFAPPLVEIQTEAPGLSTEEVESLITMPLENALNGTPWLKTLRSKSVLGLSSVVMIFQTGTDLIRARQLVQERLAAEAGRLPAVAHPPVMLSPLSSTSRLMKIGVSSATLSQMEMTVLAKWTIRPRLMAISGVANVAIWGQRDRQFQVLVDPDRLQAHGVTLDAIQRAVADAVTLNGGGFVDTPNQRLALRQITGVRTAADLAEAIVEFRSGAPIRLRDVTEIVEAFPAPIGDAVINDEPGLLLIVEKYPWGNTLEVTRNVEAALEALRPGLKGLDIDPTIFRPATFIERSLNNLTHAMLIGCLFVVVILVAFLFDWRTSLISLTAIPLSLVAAALVLYYTGATLNTMVIAGLVIALGEVVDDAIIDVENILRRLTLNRSLDKPLPPYEVVLQASLEVRSAVVYASLIVTLVFVPVLFLDGLAGSFFRPLAVTYILAIMASLLVALTVTPALSLMLLPNAKERRHDAPLTRVLKRMYGAVLPLFMHRPKSALAVIVLMFGLTGYAVTTLGEEFLPNFKETDFLMHWVEKPGASVEASTRITQRASQELMAIPGVRNFGSHIGRAEVADEVVGPNFTELWISLDPAVDYDATVAKVQAVVDGYPGLKRDLLTYLRERIKEVLTGASATVVVRIFGPDIDRLQAHAATVKKTLEGIEGATDIQLQSQVLVPQIEVQFQPDLAAPYGLAPGDVRRAVTTLVHGTKVGEFYDQQRVFGVVVRGTPEVRRTPEAIRALRIPVPGGADVPLSSVARVSLTPALSEVTREGGSRKIDVTCNVGDRDLGSVARDIQARLSQLQLGDGYHAEVLGEYALRQASTRRLMTMSALTFIAIFLLLLVDFGSARLAGLVFITLPFALVGAIAAAFISSGVLSLGSLVGLVTVIGIAARNGIMMVSHFQHLERVEGMPFGRALVMRGAEERLAPILMTALATGLALLPIALGGDRSGAAGTGDRGQGRS